MTPMLLGTFGLAGTETRVLRLVAVPGGGLVLMLASTGVDLGDGVVEGLVVVRLDGAGQVQWHRAFAVDTGWADVAVTEDGSVVLAASGAAAVDFGGGAAAEALAVVQLDLAGAHVWARRLGTPRGFLARVAAGPGGRVVAAGMFREQLTDGEAVLEERDSDQPGSDGFLVELGETGEVVWHRKLGAAAAQMRSVSIDADGVTTVLGSCVDQVDLGAGPLVAAGRGSLFVGKLDANHQVLSLVQVPGDELECEATAAVADDGSVYVGGAFRGALSWAEARFDSSEAGDAFVGRIDPDGAHAEVRVWSNGLPIAVRALAGLTGGDLLVAGAFSGALDLGAGPVQAVAEQDGFVARYGADLAGPVDLAQIGEVDAHSADGLAVTSASAWVVASGGLSDAALVGYSST